MPILFYCESCKQQIQVPDGLHGRRAACPYCEAVNTVPAAPEAPPSPEEVASEFPKHSGPPQNYSDYDSGNPYQPPGAFSTDAGFAQGNSTPVPTRIKCMQLLETNHKICMENIGEFFLLGLIYVLFLIPAIGLVLAIGFSTGILGSEYAEGSIERGVLDIFGAIMGILAGGAYTACFISYYLHWIKYGTKSITHFFSGFRNVVPILLVSFILWGPPNLLQGIGEMLIYRFAQDKATAALGVLGLVVFCGLLNIIISIKLSWSLYFIIDQKQGIGESLSNAMLYSSGNEFSLFGAGLVVTILGVLFSLATCCIGALFLFPYYVCLSATAYMLMTGQWNRR